MPFPCPACGVAVSRSPESWGLRCDACGRRLRCRALETEGAVRVYEVEPSGRPEARVRVEVPWTESDARRLRRWLAWSTAVTLGLVFVLLALALAWR